VPAVVADVAEPVAVEPAPVDDQTKVIGGLRIGIPLYNVYLNEADEWSRRLATEIGEWALELNKQVPDSAVGLAHALAGSSATVGFNALSEIARTLESSLQQAQTLAYGTPQHGQAFVNAAEEIRRLLHQFAAGFLKDPDPTIVQALLALHDLQLPKRPDLRDAGPSGFDDADFDGRPRGRPLSTRTPPCRCAPRPRPRSSSTSPRCPPPRRRHRPRPGRWRWRARRTSTSPMRSTSTCSRSSRTRRSS
jgi:chemosensory pili system protein ChpA (sensor histidine kinase/response regulator)